MTLIFLYLAGIIFIHIRLTFQSDCNTTSTSVLDCYKQCRVTYKGEKNYFNQTNGMCEIVVICNEREQYDYIMNTCSPQSANISNFPQSTNQTAYKQNETNQSQLIVPKINCTNGYIPTNSSICICYLGWVDSQSEANATVVQKCNRILDGFSNKTNNTEAANTTNGSIVIPDSTNNTTNTVITDADMPMFYKIIIIVSSVSSCCCISCVGYCCWKKRQKAAALEGNMIMQKKRDLEKNIIINDSEREGIRGGEVYPMDQIRSIITPRKVRRNYEYYPKSNVITSKRSSFEIEPPEIDYYYPQRRLTYVTPPRKTIQKMYSNRHSLVVVPFPSDDDFSDNMTSIEDEFPRDAYRRSKIYTTPPRKHQRYIDPQRGVLSHQGERYPSRKKAMTEEGLYKRRARLGNSHFAINY